LKQLQKSSDDTVDYSINFEDNMKKF